MFLIKFFLFIILKIIALINLVKIKISTKELIVGFFILFIICLPVTSKNNYLGLIAFDATVIVFFYLKDKNIIWKNIAILLLSDVICLCSDIFIAFIYSNIFNINLNNSILSYTEYIIYASIVILIVFIISKIIGSFLNNEIYFFNVKITRKTMIYIIILLLNMFAAYYLIVNSFKNANINPSTISIIQTLIFLNFIIIIVMIYLLLKAIKENSDKEAEILLKEEDLKNIKIYTEKLELINLEMRRFRHDYMNILLTLGSYIEDEDIYGLKKYFLNIIEIASKKILLNNAELAKLNNIKIFSLKGLISNKIILSQEMNIDTKIEAAETIDYINMHEIDLNRIIGIIFDNAIEEASRCLNEKFIEFAIIKKENSVMILIQNSIHGELPSLSSMYMDGFSTKGENRGLGLIILKEILSKYKNALRETKISENRFLQIIEILN